MKRRLVARKRTPACEFETRRPLADLPVEPDQLAVRPTGSRHARRSAAGGMVDLSTRRSVDRFQTQPGAVLAHPRAAGPRRGPGKQVRDKSQPASDYLRATLIVTQGAILATLLLSSREQRAPIALANPPFVTLQRTSSTELDGEAYARQMEKHMKEMKKPYEPPRVVVHGPIGDHTFTTPGGHHKTCGTQCHVDKFGELSGHHSS